MSPVYPVLLDILITFQGDESGLHIIIFDELDAV